MLCLKRLREPYLKYLVTLYFILVQILFLTLIMHDKQAYREYRDDTLSLKIAARYTVYNWRAIMSGTFSNQLSTSEKEWAQKGLEIDKYVSAEAMRRMNQRDGSLRDHMPINDDLNLLLNLWFISDANFEYYKLPRPEAFLGSKKWEALRKYYLDQGTPTHLIDMIFQTHDENDLMDCVKRTDGNRVIYINDETILFVLQAIKYYSDVVLSGFPQMKFYSSPPGFFFLRMLSNRYLMIFYFILVVGICGSQIYQDRSSGILKNLVSQPKGRQVYLRNSLINTMVLLSGIFFISALPGVVIGLLKFGIKGAMYPINGFPYTYTHFKNFPLPRHNVNHISKGGIFIIRSLKVEPQNLDHLNSGIPLIQVVISSLVIMFFLTSVMVLISFIAVNVSNKSSMVFLSSSITLLLPSLSFLYPRFAINTFPFNPLATADVVMVATGTHDFTFVSALLSLIIWSLISYAVASIVFRKRV